MAARPQNVSSSSSGISKVVFEQADVAVHRASDLPGQAEVVVRGRLMICERMELGLWLSWEPEDHIYSGLGFEVETDAALDRDWGVVTTPSQRQDTSLSSEGEPSYKISFPVTEIASVYRHESRSTLSYVQFELISQVSVPRLYFYSGDTRQLVKVLNRFLWLVVSPRNTRFFIVQEPKSAVRSRLDDSGMNSRLIEHAYNWTMSNISKVTRAVYENIGPGPLQEGHSGIENFPLPTPDEGEDLASSHLGFEILHVQEPNLGPDIEVTRGEPLHIEEWLDLMDNSGRITNVDHLYDRIFRGGVDPDIREEVWKYLLGYYNCNSTYAQREELRKAKAEEYHTMKQQWTTISQQQESRFLEFSERRQLAMKDAVRTDKLHPFYSGENNSNTTKLYSILVTYCMYNFDLGYVQGMSDLLSPLLYIFRNEVDTFWCFVGYMNSMEDNFEMEQHLMDTMMDNLGLLIKHVFPRFYHFLELNRSEHCRFCFRWILINFKREFTFEQVMQLWEVLWTQKITPHFLLFVCLAVLEAEKGHMIRNRYAYQDIIKHINEMALHIDLHRTLVRAEKLALQVRRCAELPAEVRAFAMPHTDSGTSSNLRVGSAAPSDSVEHFA